MPAVKLRRPGLKRLSALYFGLVIQVGLIAATFVIFTDSGLPGLVTAFLQGGFDAMVAASLGTLFGNPTFYLLLALAAVAELTSIPLPKGGRMSAGFLIAFAALLMLGLPACLLVANFGATVGIALSPRRTWRVALFNIGQYSLSYIAANAALNYGHVFIPGFPGPEDYGHVAFATLIYLVVTFLTVDSVLAMEKRIPIWRILWEDDRTEIVVTLALAPMALLMATMYASQAWWGISLVLIPLFATAYFVRLFLQVKKVGQELAEYNEQLQILQEVARRISSQIDLDQTLTLISQEIRRVVGYHDCMIFLLDEGGDTLVRQLTNDPFLPRTPLQLPLEHGVIGQVARDRQTAMLPDLVGASLDVGVLSGFRSLLAVPIFTEQGVLGVLALLHRDAAAFDAADERLLNVLASQAAVAIKNAQLYRSTQQLAVTDGLTKIYNRRYFEEQLAAELDRGERQGHCTSLILMDVDHFKKFNDTHGHLLGDHVLQGVARVLQKSTRDTDLVARYGGEEFAVILPETGPEAALEVAERIRRNVKAHPFWGRGQTPLQVTVSVGLASDPTSVLEPKPLIDQADTSLYQAKKQGRDRVCRTIYHADAPLEVTESRQDMRPEPTLRRPTRQVASLSLDDWHRYLRGNLDTLFAQWWEDPRVDGALTGSVPEGGAPAEPKTFWWEIAKDFVDFMLRHLGASEEERNGWSDAFESHPLYRPLQVELARLIESGATMTQLKFALWAFYRRLQAAVQSAPFSLEERMTVGVVLERLFQAVLFMVAQVWHDCYHAQPGPAPMVRELQVRLAQQLDAEASLPEIAALTARALGADASLVLESLTRIVQMDQQASIE